MDALMVTLLLTLTQATAAQKEGDPADTQPTPNTIRLDANAPRPMATLEAIAWLAGGVWRGDGLGGLTEESWSAPAAGAMMGMFRALKPAADGRHEVVFYEFLTAVEQEGTLALKLKHFNADLTGWEEKERFVVFRLARVTPDAIYFDGLTFRREAADRMTVFLALRDAAGTVREEVFRYIRQ
jgi:hypothetical protein